MRLSHNMAKVRIGRESRGLVQDRLPHHGLHGGTERVVAAFEIRPDFSIRHVLETRCAERTPGEKGCKLHERETICGKRIERVPQEFVRARTESVKRPALFENLRELGHADKVWRRSL